MQYIFRQFQHFSYHQKREKNIKYYGGDFTMAIKAKKTDKAVLKTRIKEFDPYMDCKLLVETDIRYPEVFLPKTEMPGPIQPKIRMPGRMISIYYNSAAEKYLDYAKNEVYPAARDSYLRLKAENKTHRFTPYTVQQKYTVTFNRFPYLSTVTNRISYVGGANNITAVLPDTFNTFSGRKLTLNDFFTSLKYQDIIFMTIEEEIAKNKNDYFPDYQSNLRKYFDISHFSLTEKGFTIHYPRYTIAPGSSGDLAFLVPYSFLAKFLTKPMP